MDLTRLTDVEEAGSVRASERNPPSSLFTMTLVVMAGQLVQLTTFSHNDRMIYTCKICYVHFTPSLH